MTRRALAAAALMLRADSSVGVCGATAQSNRIITAAHSCQAGEQAALSAASRRASQTPCVSAAWARAACRHLSAGRAGESARVPPALAVPILPSGRLQPGDAERMFRSMGLDTLSEEELDIAFARVDTNGDGVLSSDEVRALVADRLSAGGSAAEQQARVRGFMTRFDGNGDGQVCREEFKSTIRDIASVVDSRIWPLSACMAASGLSVGVIIPVMPQLVEELSLSVQDFGLATSAFGAARMLANFPAASAVNTVGRVAVLSGSLALMGASFCGYAAATGVASLAFARAMTGAGISGLMSAATTYVTDISNPLNRARSMAPLFAAFSAGLTAGPAVGGYLASAVSMDASFLLSAALFGGLAIAVRRAVPESAPTQAAGLRAAKGPGSMWASWGFLARTAAIRDVCLLNAVYNAVFSGAQMTLLPLLLAQEMGMNAAMMGTVFAGMSLINVVASPIAGRMADRFGSQVLLGPGSLCIAAALALMPHDGGLTGLPLPLGLWAIGNTVMGSLPSTLATTAGPPHLRVKAVAMLRTTGEPPTPSCPTISWKFVCVTFVWPLTTDLPSPVRLLRWLRVVVLGDLGFLLGGALGGAVATHTSIGSAFVGSGAALGVAGAMYSARATALAIRHWTGAR